MAEQSHKPIIQVTPKKVIAKCLVEHIFFPVVYLGRKRVANKIEPLRIKQTNISYDYCFPACNNVGDFYIQAKLCSVLSGFLFPPCMSRRLSGKLRGASGMCTPDPQGSCRWAQHLPSLYFASQKNSWEWWSVTVQSHPQMAFHETLR